MGTVLERIDSPADLRGLSHEELLTLAGEIRAEVREVVAANGGHLASNLGAVELTIALHRCFDFRTDVLVWDVGHQAYAHKLLTGRRDAFRTLRQKGGLSGFPNCGESPYDLFTTGHAGTSISSAMGLVCADELAGRRRHVVAVIGDGSLTSGIALEALNHAGALEKNLLVVLNDNRMSIGATVGALSQYLDRFRSARLYNRAKGSIRSFVSRLPGVGGAIEAGLSHIKEGIKVIVRAETLFDQLGFRSFGPVDGHRLEDLMEMLEAVRDLEGPILLHVVTQKGHGYAKAASDPARYHSAAPERVWEPEPAHVLPQPSYTSVFADALCRLSAERPEIVAITAAMEEGTGLVEFNRRFPTRFFDVGICEGHAVAFAGALSAAGQNPVAAIYSTFLQRAYDQVFHDLCLQGANVVLALDRAGIVGSDGPTHHGVYDIAYLRHLPGIRLAAPKDGAELEAMLELALANGGVWAIRFPRSRVPDVRWPATAPVALGEAEVLREGDDAALVAYGAMVVPAWEAARLLAQEGIETTVLNARFAKPLDAERLVAVASRVPLVATVEDHAVQGGFGSAVLEALTGAGVTGCRVERHGVPDCFIEHGARQELLDDLGLGPLSIAARVARTLGALNARSANDGKVLGAAR